MAPNAVKVDWLRRCGLKQYRFRPLNMEWFVSATLVPTAHYKTRQAERDPAKALSRIRSADGLGLSKLFGVPMVARQPDGRLLIAAHDVCVVVAVTTEGLVAITTLPMRCRRYKTFGVFVKIVYPIVMRKHREALKRPTLGKRIARKPNDCVLCI
jgi:hypothetical protein